MTKVSERLGGVAISAVPVFEKTRATSGRVCGDFQPQLYLCRLGQQRTRNAHGVQCDVLFVEGRSELLAEPGEQQQGAPEQDDPPQIAQLTLCNAVLSRGW